MGESRGNAQPRAKYADNQRVAPLDQFHLSPDANPESLEPVHAVVLGFDASHDGTNLQLKPIQPDHGIGCRPDRIGFQLRWLRV
jgi:hypothetical protein